MNPCVIAVNLSPTHTFSKFSVDFINLLVGLGVEGDAHCGKTVKHRSRLKIRPIPKNLRQVHLLHSELFDELNLKGFDIHPGQIGENITTKGINLLALPKSTRLIIGTAVIEITGLRNPCYQLNNLKSGLLSEVLGYDSNGNVIRKAGIMGIVLKGGEVEPGDDIIIELPKKPFIRLGKV